MWFPCHFESHLPFIEVFDLTGKSLESNSGLFFVVRGGKPLGYSIMQTPATVTRILDGDTFECTFHVRVFDLELDLKNQKIRIKDINSPEKEGATKAAGEAAAQRLWELMQGKEVLIVSDGHKSFNRLVAQVFCDYQDIGALMVSEGFAAIDIH